MLEYQFNLSQVYIASSPLQINFAKLTRYRDGSFEDLCRINCKVAFRVEGKIWDLRYRQHQTLKDGDMRPRGHDLKNGSWKDTVDAHISWERIPTPFISLFTSWKKALGKREWLINKRGAEDVVIIAVWLGGMNNVYSAYKAATLLGYNNGEQERRRLRNHYAEVLVEGGIWADEYRILACLRGEEPPRHVRLRPSAGAALKFSKVPGLDFEDEESFSPREVGTEITESLKEEMYSLTGVVDVNKFAALVTAMCRGQRDPTINVFR